MTLPVFLFSAALLCLFLALSGNFVMMALSHSNPSSRVQTVHGIFFIFMIASFLALLCSAIGILISNFVRDTKGTLTSPFLVPILLLVGIGLYRLRTKKSFSMDYSNAPSQSLELLFRFTPSAPIHCQSFLAWLEACTSLLEV